MLVLIDKLVALLIAGVVIFILVGAHTRVQRGAVELGMMYEAKKKALTLADVLERDLINAGYQTQPGEARPQAEWGIQRLTTHADGTLNRLEFQGRDTGGTLRLIRYDVEEAGLAIVNGEERQLYRLVRQRRVGATWEDDGGSTANLTRFTVETLDEDGQPTTEEFARKLRVRFTYAVMPEAQENDLLRGLRELHWGITLTPPNLKGYQDA